MPKRIPVIPEKVYTLKITLKRSQPPIWRRIQVPDTMTLGALHRVIQAVMGWEDDHMHAFEIKDMRLAAKSPFGDGDTGWGIADEDMVPLGRAIQRKSQKFTYCYDFGDNWDHEILVEAIEAPAPEGQYPICLKGKGACPPEDCGGLWGYYEMLEALRDPAHRAHVRALEWLGQDFDPDAFDFEAVNKRLRG